MSLTDVPALNRPQEVAHSALSPEEQEHAFKIVELTRIVCVGIFAALTWLHVTPVIHNIDPLAIAALLLGGYPVLREAVSNTLSRRMTMELSMTIALVAAALIREYFTALIILLFVLIAEMLEELTVDRGRRAIHALVRLMPRYAVVRQGEVDVVVPIEDVQPGTIVVVKPGAEIPVDGRVVRGHSFVDQSSITGESMAVEKVAGCEVFAGTTNLNGLIFVETVLVGQNTVFGKIIEAVEQAEHSRAPVQKLADRLAGYLVYVALVSATLTFVVTHNIRSSIAVIIVAGACGIAAGTPLAILGVIGRAARRGVIIKGGRFVELLAKVNIVVLDKTGTLTFGDPCVTRIAPAPGVSEQFLLETAVIAERLSGHPLAKAIMNRASALPAPPVEPDSLENLPGKGVRCRIGNVEILVGNRALLIESGVPVKEDTRVPAGTAVLVARSGLYLGVLQVEDRLRPEAARAVRELQELGIRVVLLTGDSKIIAESLGRILSVDEAAADLLPHDKLVRIEEMTRAGHTVAMVGDGINDAPALARAAVGIAMGGGADIARQSADVLLIGDNLLEVAETVRLARRCHRIIMTNFTGTLLVDAIGVGLAAFGFLTPLLSAFIHVSSEMTFIANSARLIPASAPDKARH